MTPRARKTIAKQLRDTADAIEAGEVVTPEDYSLAIRRLVEQRDMPRGDA